MSRCCVLLAVESYQHAFTHFSVTSMPMRLKYHGRAEEKGNDEERKLDERRGGRWEETIIGGGMIGGEEIM